ncbi:ATP-binding protein [Cryptosporangium arvum]|uniref:ATP-binding protein n=1 Tax=Cryptosporangium arvum TaxID=80871 RepID=UPI0004B430A6|nr:ATP-binding protein [Cryptosporangium arvum]
MGSLTHSRPPVPSAEQQRWTLHSAHELRDLRRSLFEALTGRSFPSGGSLEDVPEKMVLVASELATNAIRHGLPPSIIRLLRAGDSFVLDVADHDKYVSPTYADGRDPGEGGLGLRLAEKLSLDVGWYIDDEAGTKHVWAQFPASA